MPEEKDTIKQEEKEEEKKVVKKSSKSPTKKATTKKTTGKKKTDSSKKTTKKSTTKKPTTKKSTTKKMVKKATKPASKATKKDTKSKKVTKKGDSTKTKKAEAKKKAPKSAKVSLYEQWIAEAIFNLKTEEKQYVSYARIKQYLLDYMDKGLYTLIPKRTKKTLESLKEKKLLKAKKDSYTFTSQGLKTIAPEKTIKRKKIDRPEKKPKKVVETKEPVRKEIVTLSGRVSKPTTTSE